MTDTTKISSLELPSDDTYELVKIKAKDNKFTMVEVGHTCHGYLHSNPIRVGYRCEVTRSMYNSLSTSNVTKIELTEDPARVLIYTESESIYELVNLDMINASKKV